MPSAPGSSQTPETPGVLLIDKPAGVTSHDVVARVRRERRVKTGHAGTLDPFATGLLIVLLTRGATREQATFMELRKAYRVVARLGAVSTTGDRDGEITETGVLPEGELKLPTGELLQRPPTYSAVRVGGERAYKRARRGEDFEMPPEAGHRSPLPAALAGGRAAPSSRSSARRAPTCAA